ncbi:MAG: DEAD/DEAH box helicase, partial [Candidatus Eremiobacterota bacterium]
EDRIAALLPRLAHQLVLDAPGSIGAREVPCDGRLRLALRPTRAEALLGEARVRPFGELGPEFRPGHGPAAVLAHFEGRLNRAQRNLEDEARRLADLEARCPSLAARQAAPGHWEIEGLEGVLECLDELFDIPEVVVEWPEGQALRLRRPARKELSVRVREQQDWFSLEADLALDEGKVLATRQLLELAAEHRGRFLPLGEGQFLALTDALRRQLDELQSVADPTRKGVRVHPLAAGLVDLPGDRAWEQRKQRFREASLAEPEIPAALQAELRPYQEEGYRWLARLAWLEAGACLADDMGLGKTVQALALLLSRAREGPSLVVAPTSVCPNWAEEALRFAPTLSVHSLPARERGPFIDSLGPGDVLLVSYGLLQTTEEVRQRTWATVVLDEAQAIKNAATQRSKAVMELRAPVRLATTGTPVENHLGELWNLFQFLNPGLLGGWDTFQRRFLNPIERSHDGSARRRLKRLVQPFLLRRTKAQVLSDLPPRTDMVVHVEFDPEERALYEALRQQALERLDGAEFQPIEVLAQLTRLRRACCHPGLVVPGCGLAGAKLQAFLELAGELREGGHRALVFSQFVDVLTLVRQALEERRMSYEYLDGSTPAAERKQRVDAFQGGAADFFLLSLKAGGVGLNLTAADYVVHLDPWWNPAVEDQASDRAHRIGQQRPVTVYRLVASGTVEEKILHLHQHKRRLADAVLEESHRAAQLTQEELLALLAGP